MKNIIKVLLLISVCSCGDSRVIEHYRYVADGYECRDWRGSILKLCDTKEECNNYCDQSNKKR